ncbi:MAG: 50S ribosomal protein L25 [Planctomycetota bacterium]
MSESLNVKKRDQTGKLHSRRMRRGGALPAVLYGHGEAPVALAASLDEIDAVIRHGAQVVDLVGDVSGQALLQDVQWDTFHQHVLHIDLLRVAKGDRVTVEVPVHLRGEAPGEHEGGVVEHLLHAVEIETSPAAIPETLYVSINQLALGKSVAASNLEGMPEDAKLLTNGDAVVVQCVEPTAAPEEEELAASASAEPEVIGRDEDGGEAEGGD